MDPIHVGRGYEKLSYTLKQNIKGPKTMDEQIKYPVTNSYSKEFDYKRLYSCNSL